MRKRTLTHYEDKLTKGQLFLVRNRLIAKYKENRYIGDSHASEDAYVAHVAAFHANHQHYTEETCATYQRYESDGRRIYKNGQVGLEYYLVMKPQKKSSELSVIDCFLCEDVALTPALSAVLQRDAHLTGFPVSRETEMAERRLEYRRFSEEYKARLYQNETAEAKAHRLKEEADQLIFSEIANKVLMKLGLFLLMPMLLVGGGLMIAAYPLLGMIILFGGDVLFLTVTLLMIAFKKQIVAGKKRRMGLDEVVK